MKFGTIPVAQALGAVAAHSVRLKDGQLRKGVTISAADIAALVETGIQHILVAEMEAGDLDENAAATLLAKHVAGHGLRAETAFTGRVNLLAAQAGVLMLEATRITRFNSIDEAITLATLPPFRAVAAGDMVATVKIIPYGVAAADVERAIASLGGQPPLQVVPFCKTRIGIISTLLPGLKPGVVDKTVRVMAARLALAQADISADLRVEHDIQPLAQAITARASSDDEIIIVFGASAITDRRDVIPAALLMAGGSITHLGMPVDPGNLIMLGEVGGKPVVGAPGCARSPKENGFDWVLQRLLAGIPVTRADIQAMGAGGLLMEILARPQPRLPGKTP